MKSTLQLLRSPAQRLTARTTPPPLSGRVPSLTGERGQRVDPGGAMAAYGSVGTLYAIVHRLAESVSQVDWHLYRKTADGLRRYDGEETKKIVTRHAVLDLWSRPNRWQSRQEFVEATQQHLDLTGEAWWIVVRSPLSSLPLELWTVRPDRIAPIPDPERFIAGYVYASPTGEQVPLGIDDVIQIKLPNPLDPYRGLGPVQAILVDLDAARYSAEWNRNFFLNSAEPGGVIEFPEAFASDDEYNEFATRWREQHQGVGGAHRVAILERATWKDRVISQRDMQFVELRKVAREVIREAFGMHGHMLGLSEDVNKANAQAGAASYGKWLVRPRLCRIEAALNQRLLPMFGPTTDGLEMEHDDPEPPDRESDDRERTSKATAFATLVGAGVDPDAAAAVCGWPALAMQQTATEPVAAPPGGDADALALAQIIQKLYLGVGPVVTQAEAREILNRAGAGLPPAVPGDPSQPGQPAAI